MKRDDRDIVAQQDYTPLSNAELVAHIEEYARLMHNTPLSDGEWLDDIIGPARVLLARAEAAAALAYERLEAALFAEQRATDAELECDDLRDANTVQAEALETTRQTLAALTARVAELEAAQQWRPVGSNPPPAGRMFEIRRANCSLFPTYAYGKPAKKAVGSDGEFICWWVFGNGWEWRPHYELQPAPDAWRKGETTP